MAPTLFKKDKALQEPFEFGMADENKSNDKVLGMAAKEKDATATATNAVTDAAAASYHDDDIVDDDDVCLVDNMRNSGGGAGVGDGNDNPITLNDLLGLCGGTAIQAAAAAQQTTAAIAAGATAATPAAGVTNVLTGVNDGITMDSIIGGSSSSINNSLLNSSSIGSVTAGATNSNSNSLVTYTYTPLTPSSTQSSASPGQLSGKSNFDFFQFENVAQTTPLKAFQRTNISFDCSAPLSPSTPTSIYNRSFHSSPLVSDNSNSSSTNGISLDSINALYQQNNYNNLNSSSNTNLGVNLQNASTRSNSPESQNSNQSMNEPNLLDMINLLSVNSSKLASIKQQQQQQQQQAQLQQAQQQQAQEQQIQQQINRQRQQQQQLQQQQQQQQQLSQQHTVFSGYNHQQNYELHSSGSNHTLPQSQTYGNNSHFDNSTTIQNLNSSSLDNFSTVDMELAKLQNLQRINTLKLLQAQAQQMPLLTQLLQTYGGNLPNATASNNSLNLNLSATNGLNGLVGGSQAGLSTTTATSGLGGAGGDANLDMVAKFHRSSAALCDATCTWSGKLPPRSHRMLNYSPKVFLGGIPWDISEQSLIQVFKPFGPIKVEWPGKEQQADKPKGFAYIIFESDKQVKALLSACVAEIDSKNGNNYFFKISSRRIKSKNVEVKPWIIADSNFVRSSSQKLDPTKTVFVGALHGKLTAEGLFKIMDDLFDGVLYAGIDTDKYKYPIGSGRVTFSNFRSYMKAVSAAFIEIRTDKFNKKVQVDPYLEDALCSICGVQHGPYYCRELSCFRYFCRTCWEWQHSCEIVKDHVPLSRNSKSQTLVGIGPGTSSSFSLVSPASSMNSIQAHHKPQSHQLHQFQQQSHHKQQNLQHGGSNLSLLSTPGGHTPTAAALYKYQQQHQQYPLQFD